MSRIKVKAHYENGELILKEDGSEWKRIAPYDVFSVGNSMGGYIAIPSKYNKQDALTMHRLSGAEKRLSLREIIQILPSHDNFEIRPGKTYLFATSSGSARNGLAHPYRRPSNPIEAAMERKHIRVKIERVSSIDDMTFKDGGPACSHLTSGGYRYINRSDGRHKTVVRGEYVPNTHFNQYHRGCMSAPAQIQYDDATFVVVWFKSRCMNGAWKKSLQRIIITPKANHVDVAKSIDNEKSY